MWPSAGAWTLGAAAELGFLTEGEDFMLRFLLLPEGFFGWEHWSSLPGLGWRPSLAIYWCGLAAVSVWLWEGSRGFWEWLLPGDLFWGSALSLLLLLLTPVGLLQVMCAAPGCVGGVGAPGVRRPWLRCALGLLLASPPHGLALTVSYLVGVSVSHRRARARSGSGSGD